MEEEERASLIMQHQGDNHEGPDGLVVERVEVRERKDRLFRIILSIVLFAFLLFVIIDSFTNKYIETALIAFIEWVGANPGLGVLAVILMYILATGKCGPDAVFFEL